MINSLTQRYIRDLQKVDIDKFDRASIIRQYLDDNNLSIRRFAEEYGIPRSTVEDWLLWNKITEEKYNELLGQGLSHLQIYTSLRTNKSQPKQELEPIDFLLSKMSESVRLMIKTVKNNDYSPQTIENIRQLRNQINILEMTIEKLSK
jgi:DNA-binding transcriptional regulator YiaG